MKILQVIDQLKIGGGQDLLLGLVRNLDRSKHQITIAVLHGTGMFYDKEFSGEALELVVLGKHKFDPRIFFNLLDLVKKNRFDIIQTHLENAFIFGGITGRLCGVKKIISTINHMKEQVSKGSFLRYRLCEGLTDLFIALNEPIRNDLESIGIKPEKINMIPIGVETDRFLRPFDKKKLREEYGFGESDKIILRVARLEPDKKHEMFIDAMTEITKAIPQAKFIIVGDGTLRSKIEKHVYGKGLKKSVLIFGGRKDVPEINAMADLAVSLGFGTASAENMLSGLPIVSPDDVGARALIEEGKTGFVTPRDDHKRLAQQIIILLKDDTLRLKMGKRAKEMARSTFDYRSMAGRFDLTYNI